MEALAESLSGSGSFPVWIISYLIVVALGFVITRRKYAPYRARIVICFTMLFLAFVFLLLSFGVEEIEAVGSSARIAPRLWAAGLALFTLDQLWRIFQGNAPEDPATGDVKRVLLTACIVALSLWGMNTAGYLVSSSGMILLLLLLFGERRIPVLLALSGGWAAFSWYVFVRLLHISLPSGILFG